MRLAILALSATLGAVPIVAQTVQPAAGQPEPAVRQPFDRAQTAAAVAKLATTLEQDFVFPDIGKAYATRLRTQLAAGAYASFADGQAFADKVTADLQAVHKDGHLKVHVVPADARSGPEAERLGLPPRSAVIKSGWLADGVAYIRFDLFPGGEATLADLRQFIGTHATAKSLIIDVRAHRGGGLEEMDVLFPMLFARPTTLVVMDTREAVDRREGDPGPEPALRKVTAPPGIVRREHFVVPATSQSGLANAKVYLLTSKRSASAAEHLALALKRTGRATLIGETTRGAGHYGGMVPLDAEFTYAAFIPHGRTFDPDTGNGWEGTGIAPDIAVPADQALDEALKLAGVKATGAVALAALK